MARKKHKVDPLAHLAHRTKLTLEGQIDGQNRKPYRSKAQKTLAKEKAYKTEDGHYQSPAPVSYH